jgi:catechol 2,3-dioxygenase-like lactoylglutathione lyase family enzyme
MSEADRPRLVGLNHIALEVGDIEEALGFYGRIFAFELRGRGKASAFIDMGDQFIALMQGRSQAADKERHFGLVVDDRSRVRDLARAAGATILAGDFLDFLDPWGNHIQVVEYGDLQFTKAPEVLRAMGLTRLQKSEEALAQLAAKGMSSLSR